MPSESVQFERLFTKEAAAATTLANVPGTSAQARQAYLQEAAAFAQAAKTLPKSLSTQEKPITLGVGESFTTTLTVAAYFALLFSLPILIYEGYAFVIPALNKNERRAAIPVMAAAPLLFITGVVFTYIVVLPPAVHFLQGYNADQFQVLVQAKSYYSFEILTMLAVGLAFQLPLGLLGLHRVGVINGSTLTRHWRYATVIIAVIAAAMPGADPVTTGLETLPLVILFLASIVMLKIADRRAAARAAARGERLVRRRPRSTPSRCCSIFVAAAGAGPCRSSTWASPFSSAAASSCSASAPATASAACSTRSTAADSSSGQKAVVSQQEKDAHQGHPARPEQLPGLGQPRPGPLDRRRPGRQLQHVHRTVHRRRARSELDAGHPGLAEIPRADQEPGSQPRGPRRPRVRRTSELRRRSQRLGHRDPRRPQRG